MHPVTSEREREFDWEGRRARVWRTELPRMEAMLAPFDAPLIDALALEGASRVADLACGGGGTTRAIRARLAAGAELHGVDLSRELIDAAREALGPSDAITFHCGDLSSAAPPGGPFDRLSARFGVMFFPDPPAAFANLARWLAPGGRFAFAVWAKPDVNPWTSVVREVIARHVVLTPPVPDSPGPFRYGDVAKLVRLLDVAGFSEIAVQPIEAMLPLGGGLDASDAADFVLSTFSIADPVAAANEATQRAVRRDLIDTLSAHLTDGVVLLGASVYLVTGTRRA